MKRVVALAVGLATALGAGAALTARAGATGDAGTLELCLSGQGPQGQSAWADGPTSRNNALAEDGCAAWNVEVGAYDVGLESASSATNMPTPRMYENREIVRITVTRPGMKRVEQGARPSPQGPIRTSVAAGERTTVVYETRLTDSG